MSFKQPGDVGKTSHPTSPPGCFNMASGRSSLQQGAVVTVLLTGVVTGFVPSAVGQTAGTTVMRPGALDDIPRHLTEIGWDTDLPSLLVIRFMPEKTSFDAGWSGWVTEQTLKVKGFMARPRVDPWPSFFKADRSVLNGVGGQLPTADMQAFQAWCLRRSQVIPRVIVYAVPYVAAMSDGVAASESRLLPLGLAPGQPHDSQRVTAYGFAQSVVLGLTRNADDDAVVVPREVVASLPTMGVTLETRVRWSDPARLNGALLVSGEPLSVRLVADRRVLWEHQYAPVDAAAPAIAPASSRPAPPPQSDITF